MINLQKKTNKFSRFSLIPIIYIAIGFKVGSELAGILYNLMEREE